MVAVAVGLTISTARMTHELSHVTMWPGRPVEEDGNGPSRDDAGRPAWLRRTAMGPGRDDAGRLWPVEDGMAWVV